MSEFENTIHTICESYGGDRARMMDIVRDVHEKYGCCSGKAMNLIARGTGAHRVEVQSVVTFYAFYSEKPKGRVVIRLCNDIVDTMFGIEHVARAFSEELGIGFGETTADGRFTLEYTPCIGMSDQAPAALINEVVVTSLSSDSVRGIVRTLRESGDPQKLVRRLGDGNNAHKLVRAMVQNGLRKKGPVVFAEMESGNALRKALALSPVEVIRDIKTARLRGRGGAGFPAGMKWEFTRAADGDRKFVMCNADEGEPGTFKDRVILTERADLMLEGMAIAGYAIGAQEGIIYLRGEYAYLRKFLENVIENRRRDGFLGKDILGKKGFHFDVRIQLGAGAYVCGEETALISSCEGLRGDPKTRPPFPAQKGYLEQPTVVNNVETFCCVARILEKGPGWFVEMGSKGSPGTKVLSISGDCNSPGVYEFPMGVTMAEVLREAGADDVQAVQVGGPSREIVGPEGFERVICFDDLATGGAIVILNSSRNITEMARKYMDFFVEESCGYCTPCRVGNVLMMKKLEDILDGKGQLSDLDYLHDLAETVKTASRCGLGQASPNPILTTLERFRPFYEKLLRTHPKNFDPSFDLRAAVAEAEGLVGRKSAAIET
ncbi:MAG TPA: NADH:ubiquinone oxidoreductase [Verrucomicrobia bacterium]|nr:MAG: NADH:ubiquinone oxidoreductase [Lentisphaerae bacterium GWF2_57_35]HBA85981.1 NADH:ubiquinone oxidoreductase [Verrucomicrobiota bacterium]